jgi:Cdc6-like AAA superfamily ATPase
MSMRKNVLLVGPTGTSKTVVVLDELNEKYNNKEATNLSTAFSGKTSCN